MRAWTGIAGSVAVHLVVILLVPRQRTARPASRPIEIAVLEVAPRKPRDPLPVPPPLPPPVVPAARPPAPSPPPSRPAPPRGASPPIASRSTAPGELGGDGGTMPIPTDVVLDNGAGAPGGPAPAPEPPPPRPAAAKPPPPRHDDGDAPCPDPPEKPAPAARPTDIDYTPDARAAGVEGRLVLRLTIDEDGAVAAVDVVSGVEPALDAAAVAAVKSWRFTPAKLCGKPTGGVYTLARRFELGD